MTARHSLLRSAASLGLVAIAGTTLLSGVHRLTAERIADQERRAMLSQLGEILPADRYDNDLHEDRFVFSNETYFPGGQQVTAYRARRSGEPVAVILRFAAPDGYNGPIRLLAGIAADGRLTGVRVVSHKETPGLGDPIEIEKSDWIRSFEGKSLSAPAPTEWKVERDGGVFDQFTGATITPRSVVAGVRRALQYHESHRDILFEAQSEGAEHESQ